MKEKLIKLIDKIKQPDTQFLNILAALKELEKTELKNIEISLTEKLVPALTTDIQILQSLTKELLKKQNEDNLSPEQTKDQNDTYDKIKKKMSLCLETCNFITETKTIQTNTLNDRLNTLILDLNVYTLRINEPKQQNYIKKPEKKEPEKPSFISSLFLNIKNNLTSTQQKNEDKDIEDPTLLKEKESQSNTPKIQKKVKKTYVIIGEDSVKDPVEPKNISKKIEDQNFINVPVQQKNTENSHPIIIEKKPEEQKLFIIVDEKIESSYCQKISETIDSTTKTINEIQEKIKNFRENNITNLADLKESYSNNIEKIQDALLTIEIFKQEQFSKLIEALNNLRKFKNLYLQHENISKEMNNANKNFNTCFETAVRWKNIFHESLKKECENKSTLIFENLKETKEKLNVDKDIAITIQEHRDRLTFLTIFEELLQQKESSGYIIKDGKYQYIGPQTSPLRQEVILFKKELENNFFEFLKNHQAKMMLDLRDNFEKNKKTIMLDVQTNVSSFTKTESYNNYLSDLEAKAKWLYNASNHLSSTCWNFRLDILNFKNIIECEVAKELTTYEVNLKTIFKSFEKDKARLINKLDNDYKQCLVFLFKSEAWLKNIDCNIPSSDFSSDKVLLYRITELKDELLLPLKNQIGIQQLKNSSPLNIHALNKLILAFCEEEINKVISSFELIMNDFGLNDTFTVKWAHEQIKTQKIQEKLDTAFEKISLFDISTDDTSPDNQENLNKLLQLKCSIIDCKNNMGSIKKPLLQDNKKLDLTPAPISLHKEQTEKAPISPIVKPESPSQKEENSSQKIIYTPTKASLFQPSKKTPEKTKATVTLSFTPKKRE